MDRVPLDVRTADAGTDVRCDAVVGADIDIGIGQQQQGAHPGHLDRCRGEVRGLAVEVRLEPVVGSQIGTEVIVDLVTDAAAEREAALELAEIEIVGAGRWAVCNVVDATQSRLVIVDVAADVPATDINRLRLDYRRRRLLDR